MTRKSFIHLSFWLFFLLVFNFSLWIATTTVLAANPLGESWRVGQLDQTPLFRTSFAQNAGFTGSPAFVNFGYYDNQSNQTFLVFSGGIRSDGIYSAQDPIITGYNHSSKAWLPTIKIAQTENLGAFSDNHNYPQITLDNQGYLHLLQTFHNSGIDILHATSKLSRSIGSSPSDWSISKIPNTCDNTYGAVFTDNQGEIYTFYRGSKNSISYAWYEPEEYTKSSDAGKSWTSPKIVIDPGRHVNLKECQKNPDGTYINSCTDQNCAPTNIVHNFPAETSAPTTVYVGNFLQDRSRNGLWIMFRPISGHGQVNTLSNSSEGLKFVTFFDFNNDHFYSPDGRDWSETLDFNEYNNCCVLNPVDLGPNWNHFFAMENSNPVPAIYYSMTVNGQTKIMKATWDKNNNKWVNNDISSVFGNTIGTSSYSTILGLTTDPSEGTNLYIRAENIGTPPFNQCVPAVNPSDNYQKPTIIFNYHNNIWRQLRLFNNNETNINGSIADHRGWEPVQSLQVTAVTNGTREIKGIITTANNSCAKTGTVEASTNRVFPIYTNYVLGEKDLSSSQPPNNSANVPDCTSLKTSSDTNNLFLGSPARFDLTASGPAPITNVEVSVYDGTSCQNNLKPYQPLPVSGPGTYTLNWTPATPGPFIIYGRVWNDGVAECRSDCVDGPPRYSCKSAASCKISGTVKVDRSFLQNQFLPNFGKPSAVGDFNKNGIVDIFDFNLLAKYYDQ